MKVFNLTDKQHPDGRPFRPRNVLVAGKSIVPGGAVEFSTAFAPKSIAGLCRRGVAAVNAPPRWYGTAKVPVKPPEATMLNEELSDSIEPVVAVAAVDVEVEDRPRKKKNKK